MLKIAEELDRKGIDYIWFIFTTEEYNSNVIWSNRNIIKMKSRLDLDYFWSLADWYVQCSEVEGDSYSLKEALYRGVPIVVCELPYFKEIGIENGKNAIYVDLNCSNVEEVAERMRKPLKFEFKEIEDGYDKIIVKGKSRYKDDLKKIEEVKCIKRYNDVELGEIKTPEGSSYFVNKIRAEYLIDLGLVERV